MKLLKHIFLLGILLPVQLLHAQEQITSFVSGNNDNYRYSAVFASESTSTYFLEAIDGTIHILSLTDEGVQELMQVQACYDALPLESIHSQKRYFQIFSDKVVSIDKDDLSIIEYEIAEGQVYKDVKAIGDFLLFRIGQSQSFQNVIYDKEGNVVNVIPDYTSRYVSENKFIFLASDPMSDGTIYLYDLEENTIDSIFQIVDDYFIYNQKSRLLSYQGNAYFLDEQNNTFQFLGAFTPDYILESTLLQGNTIVVLESQIEEKLVRVFNTSGELLNTFEFNNAQNAYQLVGINNNSSLSFWSGIQLINYNSIEETKDTIGQHSGIGFPVIEGNTHYYEWQDVIYGYDLLSNEITSIDSIQDDFIQVYNFRVLHHGDNSFLVFAPRIFMKSGPSDQFESTGIEEFSPRGLSGPYNLTKHFGSVFIKHGNFLEIAGNELIDRQIYTSFDPVMLGEKLIILGTVEEKNGIFEMDENFTIDTIRIFEDNKFPDQALSNEEGTELIVSYRTGWPSVYELWHINDNLEAIELDYLPENNWDRIWSIKDDIVFLSSDNTLVESGKLWKIDLAQETASFVIESNTGSAHSVIDFNGNDRLVFNTYIDQPLRNSLLSYDYSTDIFEELALSQHIDSELSVYETLCDDQLLIFDNSRDNLSQTVFTTDGTNKGSVLISTVEANQSLGVGVDPYIFDEKTYFSYIQDDVTTLNRAYDCASGNLEILAGVSQPYLIQDQAWVGNTRYAILNTYDNGFGSKLIEIGEEGYVDIMSFDNYSYFNQAVFLDQNFTNKKIIAADIKPFGLELYSLLEDGTLELLFDLNDGPLDGIEYLPFDIKVFSEEDNGNLYFVGKTQEAGLQVWRTEVDGVISGATEILKDTYISVFPNPSAEFINMELSPDLKKENGKWEVYNMNGMRVLNGMTKGTDIRIDISGMLSGQYVFVLFSDERKLVKAFIKSE